MFVLLNNYNKINVSYTKVKINKLFLNSKIIIYVMMPLNNIYFFQNKILSYNLFSLNLKKKYIKSLFNFSSFSFLNNNNICIFINDNKNFLNVINFLENEKFYYSYKNSFSNLVISKSILEEYNKYYNNYIYIQFILNKIKIKLIMLLFLFLMSLVKYIK